MPRLLAAAYAVTSADGSSPLEMPHLLLPLLTASLEKLTRFFFGAEAAGVDIRVTSDALRVLFFFCSACFSALLAACCFRNVFSSFCFCCSRSCCRSAVLRFCSSSNSLLLGSLRLYQGHLRLY